jgi:cytochrome c-type biogenesis protein CcmH/NrfF
LAAHCPECNYTFSDKEDFIKYSAVGEIIQCPVCQTELIINKDLQLEVLDLESSVEHQE